MAAETWTRTSILTVTFTLGDVVAKIREIAAVNPDRIYVPTGQELGYVSEYKVDCMYVHDKDGKAVAGCLIGQALHALGVPLGYLRTCEHTDATSVLDRLNLIPYDFLSGNALWVVVVQRYQDEGKPWGECVSLADSHVALVNADPHNNGGTA